ncbi:MAG: hypothetical protein ABIU63_13660 [Chitinophagaceae bacterium]
MVQKALYPVSAIILERLNEYREVIESFSRPGLDKVEWKSTADNNVAGVNIEFEDVHNDTKSVTGDNQAFLEEQYIFQNERAIKIKYFFSNTITVKNISVI